MKYLALITILLTFFSTKSIFSNDMGSKYKIVKTTNVERDFYNRLVISQRIKEFTNRHITTKAKKRGNVTSSLINKIQNEVNYLPFENDVIEIMKNNYTVQQMQTAINNSVNLPYIEITSPKVKKELNEIVAEFWKTVDNKMSQTLSVNGF